MNTLFNWNYYKQNASAKTIQAEKTAKNRDRQVVRDLNSPPPYRGFANKFGKNIFAAINLRDKWYKELQQCISNSEILSSEGKIAVSKWEEFQNTQKGPSVPISSGQWTEEVVDAFLDRGRDETSPEAKARSDTFKEIFEMIYQYYGFNQAARNAEEIDFSAEWKTLPSKTVRGFPFNAYGKDSDDQILALGGSTFTEALSYFKKCPQNICFSGVRIQGTPGIDNAKLRLVSIPPVNYQYVNVGLVHVIMRDLKRFNSFCGWQEPKVRDEMILDAINIAEQNNCVHIPLDFSKFDRCVTLLLRNLAHQAIKRYFSNTREIDDWYRQQKRYNESQFLMLAKNNVFLPIHVKKLLLSGVIDTQLSGSLINLMLQVYICKQLNSPILFDSMLCLGDDTAIPIRKDLLDVYGYEKMLEMISEIVSKIDFKTHDKKAYPEPRMVFLQRLYVPNENIIGLGSYIRTIDSFLFKENYRESVIEGITSIPAMELYSQLLMLSTVEDREEILLPRFREYLAREWLSIDDGLYAIVKSVYNKDLSISDNANLVVSAVIKATSASEEDILAYFKVHSYDRYAVVSRTDPERFYQTHNFAQEIVKAWSAVEDRDVAEMEELLGLFDSPNVAAKSGYDSSAEVSSLDTQE